MFHGNNTITEVCLINGVAFTNDSISFLTRAVDQTYSSELYFRDLARLRTVAQVCVPELHNFYNSTDLETQVSIPKH